jgi:hypothetical protein
MANVRNYLEYTLQALGIVFGLVIIGFTFGVLFGFIPMPFTPSPFGESHTGPIVFYAESLAYDDTTDHDGAGSFKVYAGQSPYPLMEPALTMGTDTQTAKEYSSGDHLIFSLESTTTNSLDHMTYDITLPFGSSANGRLYELLWSSADDYWILTLKSAQEAQPTMVGRTIGGTTWSATGTDSYTFAATTNYHYGFIDITIAANYDALVGFFDPDEGANGEWDKLWIVATSNVSIANQGTYIQGNGWFALNDVNDFAFCVSDLLESGGLTVRWDQEGQFGVISVPITFFSPDGDICQSSGSSASVEYTFAFKECQSYDDIFYQSYDSDTLTNLHTAVTNEVVDLGGA